MIPSPAAHTDISATGAVKASGGQLVAVLLKAAPGAAATLVLYDDPDSADGTVLADMGALDGDTVPFCPAVPYVFSKGCWAVIGGAGANATVVYL
jgi:hypothetical protein